MPPSGFNDKAVKALCEFLEACYEDLLKKLEQGISAEDAVKEELNDLRRFLETFTILEK